MEIYEMAQCSGQKLQMMQDGINLAQRIRSFTHQMTTKVAQYAKKRAGWDKEENAAAMHKALEKALAEGDYVSVANYSMFLNGLGYKPGRTK